MDAAVVGLDSETHLFGPERLAPPPLCFTVSRHASLSRAELHHRDDAYDVLRNVLQGRFGGQNIAYDMVVAVNWWPDLTPTIFSAYHEKRVHDSSIREGLWNLSIVGEIGPAEKRDALPNLAYLAQKYLGRDMSKVKQGETIWRLLFHELEGVPVERWPAEAVDYAKVDAWATRQVMLQQEDSPVEWLHVAAHFCYYLMTTRGLRIDRKLKRRLQREVEKELSPDALPLIYEAGLVIPAQPPRPHVGGHKEHVPGCPRKACACPVKMTAAQPECVAKNAALVPLIMKVCSENSLEIPYTEPSKTFPNGQVKTDEETLAVLSGLDPVLRQFHTRAEKDKLRTSYFPAMEWPYGSGITAKILHAGYEPLKKTGRGSSRGNSKKAVREGRAHYASANIQQADPRLRACYPPREGWVFGAADFKAIDLVCLAQTVYKLFGESELREQLNKDVDPHAFLATAIAFEKDEKFRKRIRGKPDDEGYRTFLGLKKEPHAPGCTDKKREKGFNCHVGGCFYKEWRDLAKKVGLGFAGGMGIDTFIGLVAKELHLKLTQKEAWQLKRLWLKIYPEMSRYLKWAGEQKDGKTDWLCYTSPLGMRRARCSYTETANGNALQSPAAEGMKIAMFLVTRECYAMPGSALWGCRPVINMHDELVLEIPLSLGVAGCDAAVRRLGQLMVKGQKVICPDVKVDAKPYLTTRWVKEAEQVLNDHGQIVPWIWKGDE